QLVTARQALMPVAEHDPELAELGRRLEELSYLGADLAGDLATYAAGIDVDPSRLAWVQERRAVLTALLRKYGESSAAVLAWSAQAAAELETLDSSDERIAELTDAAARLEEELVVSGEALTRARRAAA